MSLAGLGVQRSISSVAFSLLDEIVMHGGGTTVVEISYLASLTMRFAGAGVLCVADKCRHAGGLEDRPFCCLRV